MKKLDIKNTANRSAAKKVIMSVRTITTVSHRLERSVFISIFIPTLVLNQEVGVSYRED